MHDTPPGYTNRGGERGSARAYSCSLWIVLSSTHHVNDECERRPATTILIDRRVGCLRGIKRSPYRRGTGKRNMVRKAFGAKTTPPKGGRRNPRQHICCLQCWGSRRRQIEGLSTEGRCSRGCSARDSLNLNTATGVFESGADSRGVIYIQFH